MLKAKNIAVYVAGLTIVAALVLLVYRGGLIAWIALFVGVLLLAKIWLKPSRLDLWLSLGLGISFLAGWVTTFYYVISTWESGEVVELSVDTSAGAHAARVWVMDIGSYPTIYYDAPPEVAKSLLAGNPVKFTRAGKTSTRIPKATPVELLPEDKAALILNAMASKYGERNGAADIYYLMLGSPRGRVALVADIIE